MILHHPRKLQRPFAEAQQQMQRMLVHHLSTSASGLSLLFQCFASWMYKDESGSSALPWQ